MAKLSNYAEGKLYDHTFRNIPWTSPPNVYVALHTADPGEDCTNAELSGDNYARALISAMGAATDGIGKNSAIITFASPSASWGTITHFSVWDAISGGNPVIYSPLDASKLVNLNEIVRYEIDKLSLGYA